MDDIGVSWWITESRKDSTVACDGIACEYSGDGMVMFLTSGHCRVSGTICIPVSSPIAEPESPLSIPYALIIGLVFVWALYIGTIERWFEPRRGK